MEITDARFFVLWFTLVTIVSDVVGDDDEKAVTLVKPLSVDQPLLMSFDKAGAKRAPAQWRNVQSLINL